MPIIEKYSAQRAQQVSGLSVKPEQAIFAIDNVSGLIAKLAAHEHPHLVIVEDQVVGFFILDLAYSASYDFCPPDSLGIRSLLIDQHSQGKGIAKKVLLQLPNYIEKVYPFFRALYLTVNCRNKAAYQCYAQCGFQDTGDLYRGGPAGPQHIMNYKMLV
ncbi:GNAT family N-acetyltransferase [Agarivorans sp. QJM3NY_25]|uniref:GNAT family N-acetyltransferase n=1 Tax=Agarivorans sp. QJM3NY_25 TaxID=3421430 RepID=UPI003D7DC421